MIKLLKKLETAYALEEQEKIENAAANAPVAAAETDATT